MNYIVKKVFKKLKNIYQKYSVEEVFYRLSDKNMKRLQNKRLFAKGYEFINRSSSSENLLLIIAGFQEYYWDAVFERVRRNQNMFTEKIDICICVPGEDGEILKQIAEKYGWSYLKIKKDLLAQAQNTAIKLHENAKWIYKIDEDILISDNYFSKLKDAYVNIELKHNKEIGFIAPLINLNACGVEKFLRTINKYDEFECQFGRLIIGLNKPIHRDGEVATWIWNSSIPFDEISRKIEKENDTVYYECPIRFSVGAILLKREFWEEMGGFLVKNIGCMGAEEEQMNAFCMNQMRSIIVVANVFAGHLGFFHQKQNCHKFFNEHQKEIRINENK